MGDGFDLAAHARAMRAAGWWQDRTFDDLLESAIAASPQKKAVVAYRKDWGFERPAKVLTYAELGDAVAQAAGSLRALGVGPGDIVGLMLPNWWEFVVAALAACRIGAVPNPLMPIFRERELRFMLGFAGTKAIFVPQTFRGHDFPPMIDRMRPELPALEHVIVVDGDGPQSFDRLIMQSDAAPVPAAEGTPADPGEMALLIYTSGTTGEPKGVMHCFNTQIACVTALGNRLGLTREDVHFAVAPFGHMTGYTEMMVQGIHCGGTLVLQDVWEPEAGAEIMLREGATHMAAATPFLSDICNGIAKGGPVPGLRSFLCGGAQIPPVVIERAPQMMNLGVSSLWGMSESLAGSLTEPERAQEKSATTDGHAVDGVELLIADENLVPLPQGETGRLWFRGAQQFLGYYKRPGLDGRGPEGWFDTGDLASMDAEGYIRINGRSKDIVIRGGENIPVVEIESILYRHPRVTDAAIMGYPDPRMGERACAFLVLADREPFTMDELRAWMAASAAARPYWPEAVEVIETMPRNAAGKIQKFLLREQAARYAAG